MILNLLNLNLFLLIIHVTLAEKEEDICSDRSCYPATGNLLIGRKNKLFASSTCGLRGEERYCIVSHLEDDSKCFRCDSRLPWSANRNSHRIENVVSENYEDRTLNWWQSENGVQNVSIRFDLEVEFHFTHLIMTFRSFRPAAMYIERSADFGKTWSVYRYFAYDCSTSFPGIPEGPPKNHNDVICTRKYSDVAPSTGGELVYKVISPHIHTNDPYSIEIAKLLKITNLRITFTKLHTLGDDLLDYRPEIDEKYYYALYELVVRGSCSCYGHAFRCIPMEDEGVGTEHLQDMVYGRCECTHNTKGLNCDECEDFYNDSPWMPAFGNQTNQCRRCECNNHAVRCHFDKAVYYESGKVSGGVCDECQHNTQGKNCEQCKPYYYHDPNRPITDPYVCRPCECNKLGSQFQGICQSETNKNLSSVAGKCYCKTNVNGQNCDRCKNGFWDLSEDNPDGCKPCTCDSIGTINNEGCNKNDGTCTCKIFVEGENCEKCKKNYYGLSDHPDGCKFCDCDYGGSLNQSCNVITGQCNCRENFSGRRCNTTISSTYCPAIDKYTFEAEDAKNLVEVIEREAPLSGRDPTWTGIGFAKVVENSNLTFVINNVNHSGQYNIVLRYELQDPNQGWDDIKITVVRPNNDPESNSLCGNISPSDDFLTARFYPNYRYIEITPTICIEKGINYEIRLFFGERRVGYADKSSQVLIDSLVLVPVTESIDFFHGSPEAEYRKSIYDRYQCRAQTLQLVPFNYLSKECVEYICRIAGAVFQKAEDCDCDLTGSLSNICKSSGGQCQCKLNVAGRKCDRCASGTYGFEPSGCSPCNCDSVGALNGVCDKVSGQCVCRDRGITGLRCNQCHNGFWSFPTCRTCQCNGHASSCDQETGFCIECRNLTTGSNCEACVPGYYGDPRLGYNLPCKPCLCPKGPGSGSQHADTCHIIPGSSEVHCNCREGYIGENCEKCQQNYWGNPTETGGSCEKCDCNGNIDRNIPDSCDSQTGDCLKCLYYTEGSQCEHCKNGYFGEAKIRTCQRCVCNHLGTNSTIGECDRITGQCPCFPNVTGIRCDECIPLHYNLNSGQGCSPCSCDSNGVIIDPNTKLPYLECNSNDGQCHCKPGSGGRRCSECQDFYWGNPVIGECKRCECNPVGSISSQCNRKSGACDCRPGSGGFYCNECARGYTGIWPNCEPCGECFNNWDNILQDIKLNLDNLIDRANNIEDTGISSEYDQAFEAMEKQIIEVKKKLEGINITKDDVDNLKKRMDNLQDKIDSAKEKLQERNQRVTRIQTNVDLAHEDIRSLNATTKLLIELAEALNQNATQIRRSDVKGAYELVRESAKKSADFQHIITQEVAKISNSESDRIKADQLLNEHQRDFDIHYNENQVKLKDIGISISKLEEAIPSLNKKVCGAETATCDAMCGGPSSMCSFCGGASCSGSVSKAEQAREFANEALDKAQEKQHEAEELLKRLRESKAEIEGTKRESQEALRLAKLEVEKANATKITLEKQINETKKFFELDQARPEGIQSYIDQIFNITIPFNEEQIQELSDDIRKKILNTKDTNKILEETHGNKTAALSLQQAAELASKRAARIHNVTIAIRSALESAEKAQKEAQDSLKKINKNIQQTKSTLSATEEEVNALETRANNAAKKIHAMLNTTDNLKAEYIKITSNSKSATANANNATDLVKIVEDKHLNLKLIYDKVLKMLEERENGNEERKKNAEDLRRRTTELLAKIKRSREDKNSLIERADSLDIELTGFRAIIDSLSEQIDSVAQEIDRRVEYHSTCDA